MHIVRQDQDQEWISSEGGPLLILPRSLVPAWGGIDAPDDVVPAFESGTFVTDYDRACAVDDYLGLISVANGRGLVLGDEPMLTTWLPDAAYPDTAGILVRWVYAETFDSVYRHLQFLSPDLWSPSGLSFDVPDNLLCLFDAALSADEVDNRYLPIHLVPHVYDLWTAIYQPDQHTSLILHRFCAGK